jgi:hypothetical protein
LGREHQVERVRFAQIVVGIRRLGFRVLEGDGHLFGVELVDARLQIFQFTTTIRLEHRILQQFFKLRLEQVIGAEALLRDDIVHHEIGELFDVSARRIHVFSRPSVIESPIIVRLASVSIRTTS